MHKDVPYLLLSGQVKAMVGHDLDAVRGSRVSSTVSCRGHLATMEVVDAEHTAMDDQLDLSA